ncbi:crinkler family protein [Gigaspora margarita]|uniref:Crinkler family protein n=1 Tax=Gigaspora margarita TaxID=4874 RepID=A0A8H3XGI3_GIGMA|nr:crinkler family protein [Gigaspora margarita]
MIFCLISGDPIRKAFHIKICRDMKVSQIRKLLINDKIQFAHIDEEDSHIDEEDLILWHIDIPTIDKDLGTTIKVEDIKGGIEMSLITKEKILEFLQVKFKKLSGILLITTYGHNFLFVGKTTTARCLTESFISQFKAAYKGCNRNKRQIFISAGTPGTGQTRNLIETIPMIRSCFPDFATNEVSNEMQKLSHLLDDPVQILMTYNNDCLPLNIEKTLGANAAIGLRILHHYFASQLSYEDFIDQMIAKFGYEPLKQQLIVPMAINIIAKSDNEQEKKQYLKEVILALCGAMCCKFGINNVFIICHLAGTVLTPLLNIITSSLYQHITLSTPLLLPIDINSLFEQLQLTKSWWLNSLLLQATAYDIMLPRGIEAFLEYISNSISKGLSPSNIDYIEAANCARDRIYLPLIPSLLAKEILVAIILQFPVRRISTVCTIGNTNYTWEYLESQAETNKDVEKIPDNVILTDKSSFHKLFGIFATRLQFMMTNKININTVINVNLLKYIVGVGSKYAEKIIKNRPYKNKNDMKEKLQLLDIPNEMILNVLESVEY